MIFPIGSAYARSVQAILDGHAKMRQGGQERPTPDEHEKIDAAWDELAPHEQDRLWGLAADLYQLQGAEKRARPSLADGPPEFFAQRIGEAMKSGAWEEALRLLRFGPTGLSQAQVAVFRGRAWHALGHDEVALLFFDYAAELEGSALVSVSA